MLNIKYVYHAILTPTNDGYDVNFPDLPGCRTCGATLAEALEMASDAAATWLRDAENKKEPIPVDSVPADVRLPAFVKSVMVDTDPFYSKENMDRLRKRISDVESGKAKLTEHDLIEVEAFIGSADFPPEYDDPDFDPDYMIARDADYRAEGLIE